MKQEMNKYTSTDQQVWNTLFTRQAENLKTFAGKPYLESLSRIEPVLNGNSIPDFKDVSNWFTDQTGWEIEVVPGLIPVEDFFALLANKKFCSSTWLRSPENLDYLEEPDMFHDTFGHIPLLSHPVFSDFIHEFGKIGIELVSDHEAVLALQRLYWFTIEFGLMREDELKVYGAGIISSYGETKTSVSSSVKHLKFDIEEIMKKEFRTDVMQEEYFVIDSFGELYNSLSAVKARFNI